MAELSDEQLVAEFKATADFGCLDALAKRHVAGIRSIIYPIVLNHEDADDLTQETLLKIVKSLPRFRECSKFTTWMYRIALNTTFDFIRKNHRRSLNISISADIEQATNPDASPSNALYDREFDTHVREAMESLSPRLREAVTLVAIQGMSPGEAAQTVGCLKATMYRRLHDARRMLRKSLKQYLSIYPHSPTTASDGKQCDRRPLHGYAAVEGS